MKCLYQMTVSEIAELSDRMVSMSNKEFQIFADSLISANRANNISSGLQTTVMQHRAYNIYLFLCTFLREC